MRKSNGAWRERQMGGGMARKSNGGGRYGEKLKCGGGGYGKKVKWGVARKSNGGGGGMARKVIVKNSLQC